MIWLFQGMKRSYQAMIRLYQTILLWQNTLRERCRIWMATARERHTIRCVLIATLVRTNHPSSTFHSSQWTKGFLCSTDGNNFRRKRKHKSVCETEVKWRIINNLYWNERETANYQHNKYEWEGDKENFCWHIAKTTKLWCKPMDFRLKWQRVNVGLSCLGYIQKLQ